MSEEKKKCFVIMPISTPDRFLSDYDNDENHFDRVLEYFFKPVIDLLGYELIRPNVDGSKIIHGTIINNLIESDLVLCDISTLNPNVFLELGIRTALDKPVCMIKDDKTKIPFDTAPIHCHEYASNLKLWNGENEKKKLEGHIEKTAKESKGINQMWHYFNITTKAKEDFEKVGEKDKFDFLITMISSIESRLNQITHSSRKVDDHGSVVPNYVRTLSSALNSKLAKIYKNEPVPLRSIEFISDRHVILNMEENRLPPSKLKQILDIGHELDVIVEARETGEIEMVDDK